VNDPSDVLVTVERIVSILESAGSSWADSIAKVGAAVAASTSPEELTSNVKLLLSMYGGMGSFNDVVLQSRAGVSPDQPELDRLRSLLYQQARELIASG
jgi:hypothetical protein